MVYFALEQGYHVATMLAVGTAALVLAGVFYRRSFRQIPRSRWWTLFGLRAFAIVLVVLLLFRPVFSLEREVIQRRSLVFLLDTSASMRTADDATGVARFDQARDRVAAWRGTLNKDFDLQVVAFSDGATLLEPTADLAGLRPTGAATSLTRGLEAAAKAVPDGDVEAVFLFSDGIHNATGDPVATARRLGLVVHTVGVGYGLRNSPSYRDVRVAGLECPDQLTVNNRAAIQAHVGQVGLGGRVVQVVLEEDGKPVDRADVELRDAEAPQEVPFQYVPTVKGRHTYTARIPTLPEEKIGENNHRSAVAQVVDARIRVLYIEGALRAEYGALVQRFLSKDPDIEFCALVQTRPNVFVQRTNMGDVPIHGLPGDPAILERFDVFLIGDLDSTSWKPEQMELLSRRIRAGAGLLMLGGDHSLGPGGYGGTALEEVLPTFLGGREVGQVTEPFLPTLTPDGLAHPIFANIGTFFPTLSAPPRTAGLPPLEGCVKVVGARPGATVLAVYPGGAAPMPVLAVQPVGKGRAATFTGDTTRNWQQAPRALDQESPFARFWGQMVRWLANRTETIQAEAGVTARTEKAYYEPDSSITVSAVVRDKGGEGTDEAQVTARVRGPGGEGETVALSPVPDSSGTYSGVFEPKRPGTYAIRVDATLGTAVLHAETIAAEVGRPNLEFDRLDLDDRMLANIAEATGGRYQHISGADRLIDGLDRDQRRRSLTLEQPLYWPKPFWVLFVGVLVTEWVLRRRYQLR